MLLIAGTQNNTHWQKLASRYHVLSMHSQRTFYKKHYRNQHLFTYIHTYNHFTALLDFVQDYLGEPVPER